MRFRQEYGEKRYSIQYYALLGMEDFFFFYSKNSWGIWYFGWKLGKALFLTILCIIGGGRKKGKKINDDMGDSWEDNVRYVH